MPCNQTIAIGCCPHDETEPIYDLRKRVWEKHPKMLLIYSETDENADPNGALYYRKIMEIHNVCVIMIRQKSSFHNLLLKSVLPATRMLNSLMEDETRFCGIQISTEPTSEDHW